MEEILVNIPIEVGNMKLPSPDLVQYYKDLQDRILYIDRGIDIDSLEIVKQILLWNREDDDKNIPVDERKPIKLLIFSEGGCLYTCYSIIDACEASKTPVITVNMGISMSAGFLILLSGHKRYCMKRSQALIHKGSGVVHGSYDDIQSHVKGYEKQMDLMKEYILERTKISKQLYTKRSKDEWILFADEQVQHGIVDSIITSLDEI